MKRQQDFTVVANRPVGNGYHTITLAVPQGQPLEDCQPGQFVQVQCPGTKKLLRRPISIHDADTAKGQLSLLVHQVGDDTRMMCESRPGDCLNLVYPLGHGFTLDIAAETLLVGGGVGVAPLLAVAKAFFAATGKKVSLIYGARTVAELIDLSDYEDVCTIFVCTDDGSCGHCGRVTTHPEFFSGKYRSVKACGPVPMMKAVAAEISKRPEVECEVSLENLMACGLGACLCCVEDTVEGNVCVCKEGPVFNIKQLKWQS